MRLHEQVQELKINRADCIDAIYELSHYLSLDKFKNTDTQLNNYVQVSDVQSRLSLILQALTK
jgi:hypothetical protein